MKLAYIILAHTAPTHLARLVNRLQHKDDVFFIHIDLKANIDSFKEALSTSTANYQFVKQREDGRWGDVGIVKATLNVLKEVVNHSLKFDHVILLSGVDYPIKKTEIIRQFYTEHKEYSFMTYEPFPVKRLNFGGMDRINCYTYNFLGRRETFLPFSWTKHLSFRGKVLNLLLGIRSIFKPKRIFPFGWKAYYGSQWWSMSNDAAKFVVQYVKHQPAYLDYHHYTQLSDELFFQSILLNAYHRQDLIVNDNKRLIEFSEDASHPRVFGLDNVKQLMQSQQLFARKFEVDSTILNEIDHQHNS